MATQTPKAVYTIIESKKNDGDDYWLRIGSAFKNKDGSENIELNALPVNGKLHVREAKAKEESPEADRRHPDDR